MTALAPAANCSVPHLTSGLANAPWWTLAAVVLGAAISLGVTWFVGPQVARRQRRDERREDALLLLHSTAVAIEVQVEMMGVGLDILSTLTEIRGWIDIKEDDIGRTAHDQDLADLTRMVVDQIDRAAKVALDAAGSLREFPSLLARATDPELDAAWTTLSTGLLVCQSLGIDSRPRRKANRALDARKYVIPMRGALNTIKRRSNVLLGHLPDR